MINNQIQEEITRLITRFVIEVISLRKKIKDKGSKSYCDEVDLIADKYRKESIETFSDKKVVFNVHKYINDYLLNVFFQSNQDKLPAFHPNEASDCNITFDLPQEYRENSTKDNSLES